MCTLSPTIIRLNGKIAFPLIGEVQAAGLTPRQLVADVTFKLSKYLNDPRVTMHMAHRTKE
jgi:polysaccharide export outer membrane protein